MQYTEKEVASLIEQVEKTFTAHLAKAEEEFNLAKSESAATGVDGSETLAKAEDDKPEDKKEPEAKKEESAPKSDDKEAESAAPAAEGAAPAAKDAPAEGEAPAPAEDAAPAAAPAADAASAYDDEDMAHMLEMYGSMSREELKAHHDAVKQCLDQMGMAKCGEMAPEAAPAAEVAAPAAAAEAPMAKSEGSIDLSNIAVSKEVELLKSENASKDSKIEELKKSLDTVTEILTKMVKKSAPVGKAITNLEAVAKSETVKEAKVLTKTEITSILNRKAAETSLAKSDREAINAYYAAGQVSTTGISHLLGGK